MSILDFVNTTGKKSQRQGLQESKKKDGAKKAGSPNYSRSRSVSPSSKSRERSQKKSPKQVRISEFSAEKDKEREKSKRHKDDHNHTSFCERKKFKKESNEEKKSRLFGEASSGVKPLMASDSRTKEQKLIEKLIYKDCYDSSGNLQSRQSFNKLYNLNPQSFLGASKRQERSDSKGSSNNYHPKNKDSYKRELIDRGNKYMYDSIKDNVDSQGKQTSSIEKMNLKFLEFR